MTTTRRRKRHERLLEGTERGLDFCPLSVHFFGIFFFFPSFKILFTFLKKKKFLLFLILVGSGKTGKKRHVNKYSIFRFYVSSAR